MPVKMQLRCPHCKVQYSRETEAHEEFKGPVLLMVRCPKCGGPDVFEYKVRGKKVEVIMERSTRVLELRDRIGLPP